jgi:hypothetical protein
VDVITLDGGQSAQFNASVRGVTLLIDLDFSGGFQYITTFSSPIVANGHTYTALGNILSVGDFRESEVLTTDKLVLRLSLVNTSMLAYVLGPATVYRGRDVRIYLQLLNDKWIPVEAPILRWSGMMDKVRINRKPTKTGDSASTGDIELVCQRAGLSRFRNVLGFRMTHAQQQLDYPGDMGLEYTEQLLTDPPVWMTKQFQQLP